MITDPLEQGNGSRTKEPKPGVTTQTSMFRETSAAVVLGSSQELSVYKVMGISVALALAKVAARKSAHATRTTSIVVRRVEARRS